MSFCDQQEANILFKKLPFYNALIENSHAKCLSNLDMLLQLPFYDELNMVKTSKAFKGYARSCSTEMIESKDPSVQLTVSKPSIKDLFKDLLNEIKGFRYQITLKVLLSKCKENTDRDSAPAYFNSTTETAIGPQYSLGRYF